MAITDEIINRSFSNNILTITWKKIGDFHYKKTSKGWEQVELGLTMSKRQNEFLNEQLKLV
jgi:hypothetical protein